MCFSFVSGPGFTIDHLWGTHCAGAGARGRENKATLKRISTGTEPEMGRDYCSIQSAQGLRAMAMAT